MMKNIGFPIPPLRFDCGEEVQLQVDMIAVLRSAGVENLRFEKCWRCEQEHIVPLPDLSTITANVSLKTSLAVAELTR